MMKNTTNFISYDNTIELPNKELFPEKLQNHVILLSKEEVLSRIGDNKRQIIETINNKQEAQQELIEKKQHLGLKTDKFITSRQGIESVKLSDRELELHQRCSELARLIHRYDSIELPRYLENLHYINTEHTSRVIKDLTTKLNLLENSTQPVSTVSNGLNKSNYFGLDELQGLKTQVNEQAEITQQIVDYMNKGFEQDRIELREYMNITDSKLESIQENVNLTNTINELHAESQAKRAGDATYIEELEEYIDCINERYSDRISRFDHQLMELVVHENPRNVPFLRKLEIENQVLRQDQIRILESQSRALGEAISAAKDADDLQKQVKSLRYENLELKNKIDELQRRLQETLRK